MPTYCFIPTLSISSVTFSGKNSFSWQQKGHGDISAEFIHAFNAPFTLSRSPHKRKTILQKKKRLQNLCQNTTFFPWIRIKLPGKLETKGSKMVLIESSMKSLCPFPVSLLSGSLSGIKPAKLIEIHCTSVQHFFTLMSRETRGILSESVFSIMRSGFDWIYVIMSFFFYWVSADIYLSLICVIGLP